MKYARLCFNLRYQNDHVTLLHVAKLGVPVTEAELLIFRQPLNPPVSLPGSSVLVIKDAVSKPNASQNKTEALQGKIDSMAGMEEGRVGRQICPAVYVVSKYY